MNYKKIGMALLLLVWVITLIYVPNVVEANRTEGLSLNLDRTAEETEALFPAMRLSIPDMPVTYGSCVFTLTSLAPVASKQRIESTRMIQAVLNVSNNGSLPETLYPKDIYFYGTIPGLCSSIQYQPDNRFDLVEPVSIEPGMSRQITLNYTVYNDSVAGFYMDIFLPEIEGQRLIIPTLRPEEAIPLIEEDATIILMDVRSLEAFEKGHLPNAINVPLDQVQESILELIPDKDTTIFINCKTGKRSYSASVILYQMGYDNVHSIGGIDYWPEDWVLID